MERVPKKFFLTKGSGVGQTALLSFEAALQDAKIAQYNLVKVSSIIPPNCREISREEGLMYLDRGEIVYTVLAENHTEITGHKISSAVGIARSNKPNLQGYVYEHKDENKSSITTGKFAEKCAILMLSKAAGVNTQEIEPVKGNIQIKKIISESKYLSFQAELAKAGKYLTVIAAVVFIL